MKNKKLLWGIIFVAMNMRLPITMMPPLINEIKKSTGLPSSLAGLLTSIPLVTFAVMSPIIVKLAKKYGNKLVILVLFSLLVLGSFLRLIPTVFAIFLGTFLIGIGIDSGNVLLPAVIKDEFPQHVAFGTSLYTVSMMFAASIGSALSGYLIGITSLKNTIFILSLISILGLVFWLPNLNKAAEKKEIKTLAHKKYRSVWNQKISWLVTISFGLQALISYSLITWIPSIILDRGASTMVASTTLTIFQFAGIPFSFFTPILAEKKWGMKFLLAVTFFGFSGGIFGMLLPNASAGYYFFLGLIAGFASSAAFNLVIVFFTKKTTNPIQTAEISGMSQSIGYLLAAVGPIVFGMIRSTFNTWSISLYLSIFLTICLTLVGIALYKSGTIKE